MWAHDNEFHHNSTGMTTDSFASGHPGMPQDCAKWENNRIYSNNEDYFNDERDAYCKNTPTDKRDPKVVCPTFQVPVGTGIGIFGGNGDIVRDNHIYDNWRDGMKLLFVPAAFRGEPDGRDRHVVRQHDRPQQDGRPARRRARPERQRLLVGRGGARQLLDRQHRPGREHSRPRTSCSACPTCPGSTRVQPRHRRQDGQPGHVLDLGPVREPRPAGL